MIVVDTSVVYKWFVEEDVALTEKARKLLGQFLERNEELIAPTILLYELANILTYKSNLTPADIESVWVQFKRIKLPLFEPTTEFMKRCTHFARQYDITAYDAAYALLAQEKDCLLTTADQKLAQHLSMPFIKLLRAT